MPFRIIVVFVGAIATAIGAVIYPYLGVLVLLFLNFGRPQDDRPNIEPLHIPMMIAIAVLIGSFFKMGSICPQALLALRRLKLVIVLYMLYALSSANNWTPLSSNRMYEFSVLVMLCVLTLTWITTEARLRAYILAILASASFIILAALRNPTPYTEHIAGQAFERMAIAKGATVFGNSNYLALFMVVTLFLSLSLLGFYRSLWRRTFLLLIVAGSAYVFFKANSRGASIALASGLLVLWIIQRHKIKSAMFALVLIGIGICAAPKSYWDRVRTVGHYEEDTSATKRLELWNIALNLIPEHPLLGVGPDNFTLYAPDTPHDAYLQVGSEVGVPALLMYCAMLVSAMYATWQACRRSALKGASGAYIHAASQGILCSLIAIMIQGFTTGLAHREVVYVFVSLGACVYGLAGGNAHNDEVGSTGEETDRMQPSFA